MQVSLRVQAVEFGGADQRADGFGPLAARIGADEQVYATGSEFTADIDESGL
jgi:hypothetical protein